MSGLLLELRRQIAHNRRKAAYEERMRASAQEKPQEVFSQKTKETKPDTEIQPEVQERKVNVVSREDFLLSQIDEFRERAKQLQSLLDSRETEAQELQTLVDERQEKADALGQILDSKYHSCQGKNTDRMHSAFHNGKLVQAFIHAAEQIRNISVTFYIFCMYFLGDFCFCRGQLFFDLRKRIFQFLCFFFI